MPLIDAGPRVAFVSQREARHREVIELLTRTRFPLFTTHACFTEAMYFLQKFGGVRAQVGLAQLYIHGELRFFEIDVALMARVQDAMLRYANVPMDYADATLLIAAEMTRDTKIITFDSDFRIYRLADGTAFDLELA